MERKFFIKTDRIGFSKWAAEDIALAELLWGEATITRFLSSTGTFSPSDIADRLRSELENDLTYGVQYWPIFELQTNELIGCCGLRPYLVGKYELGFHLCSRFWGQGLAAEAGRAVLTYAFSVLHIKEVFAGHHPHNKASQKIISKLGFTCIGDEFYEPTGLMHPIYELKQKKYNQDR